VGHSARAGEKSGKRTGEEKGKKGKTGKGQKEKGKRMKESGDKKEKTMGRETPILIVNLGETKNLTLTTRQISRSSANILCSCPRCPQILNYFQRQQYTVSKKTSPTSQACGSTALC